MSKSPVVGGSWGSQPGWSRQWEAGKAGRGYAEPLGSKGNACLMKTACGEGEVVWTTFYW